MAAIIGVLSVGVLAGVVVGVVLSLGWLVYVATRPPMPLLGREAGTQVFRDLDENPDDETFPGIAVLRIDGGLFFATAEALEDRVRELADADPDRRALVLDLEGVNFIDSQGAAKLTEIYELTEADGVTLRLARVKPQVSRSWKPTGSSTASAPTTSTATSTWLSRSSGPPTASESAGDVAAGVDRPRRGGLQRGRQREVDRRGASVSARTVDRSSLR